MTWHPLRRWSLKARVTVFSLLIFVGSIWSLFFFASHLLRQHMIRSLGRQQLSIVRAIGKGINEDLRLRLQALQNAAAVLAPFMRDVPVLQRELNQQTGLSLLFNGGVLIMDRHGTELVDMPHLASRAGLNFMDRAWVVASLDDGKAVIGPPVKTKKQKEPIFVTIAPIRDAAGRVAGAIAGVVDLEKRSFLDSISDLRYGRGGGYLLVDAKARVVVTASDKRRVVQKYPAAGTNPPLDRALHSNGGIFSFRDPLGVEVLNASVVIPASGWHLVVSLPLAEALSPIKAVQRSMLVATLFFTLIAGGLTWWMMRRQMMPLTRAARAISGFGESDHYPEALPIAREDEIGVLFGGFNRLLQILEKREDAIRESEERFRSLTEMSSDWYWEQDEHFRFRRRTSPYGRVLDIPANVVLGKTRMELGLDRGPLEALEKHRKIVEAHLPFREFEFWVVHEGKGRVYISTSGVPLFNAQGQFTGYRGVGSNITDRKLAEATLIRHGSELAAAYGKLAETEEQERRRLARRLHDDVGHNLVALNLSLSRLNSELPGDATGGPRKRVGEAMVLVEETAQRIRYVMSTLRPPMLDDYGLYATLRWWVHESAVRSGITIELVGEEASPRLASNVELALFRVAQEALLNAIKHSGAKRIVVTYETKPERVTIRVADDGRGLPVNSGTGEPAKFTWGMLNMRERAAAVGASLRIESGDAGGVQVIVELPRR